MLFRKSFGAIVLGASLLGGAAALAHDDPKARHGGIVQIVNDVSYELVVGESGAAVYLTDHGKPVPTKGMTGKLTVMNAAQRTDADLIATGDKLEAKGVKLAKGAKVVAVLTTVDKKAVTVRFAVK